MDYEKKYKEALERAREFQHDNCWVTTIFPELKESEDEKIRKEIIEVFKSLGEGKIPVDINYTDIFTWLEKQGEQKVSVVDFKAKDWYVSKVDGKIHNMTYNPTDKVEPNPTWSKEDEIGLGDALWAIKQARTIAKDENDMGNLWYAERWLKLLKDRIKGK